MSEIDKNVVLAVTALELLSASLASSEVVFKNHAKILRKFKDELIEEGFSPEDAQRIVERYNISR